MLLTSDSTLHLCTVHVDAFVSSSSTVETRKTSETILNRKSRVSWVCSETVKESKELQRFSAVQPNPTKFCHSNNALIPFRDNSSAMQSRSKQTRLNKILTQLTTRTKRKEIKSSQFFQPQIFSPYTQLKVFVQTNTRLPMLIPLKFIPHDSSNVSWNVCRWNDDKTVCLRLWIFEIWDISVFEP